MGILKLLHEIKLKRHTFTGILSTIVLVAAVCLFVIRTSHFARMDKTADAKSIYASSLMMHRGIIPYNNHKMREIWFQATGDESCLLGSPPGSRGLEFVYPLQTSIFFLPLSLLRWDIFRSVITAMIALSNAAIILLAIALWAPDETLNVKLWIIAAALQCPALNNVSAQGQLTTISFAFALAGWYAYRRNKPILTSIFMALSSIKFTMTIPFLALWLWKREYKVFTIAMVCIVAVTFVSAAPTGVIPTIKAMHAAMTKETEFGADDDTSARNPDQIGIINLGATIHKMLTGRNALAEVITDGLIVFCIGGLLCVIPRIPLSETEGLEVALFNVAGLLIFYHRTYDMALLITAGIALLPFLRRSRLSFETIILAISLVVLSYVCSSFRLMQIVGEWISWHQTIFLFFSFSRIIIVFCFIAGLFQLHRCTDVGKKS